MLTKYGIKLAKNSVQADWLRSKGGGDVNNKMGVIIKKSGTIKWDNYIEELSNSLAIIISTQTSFQHFRHSINIYRYC